MEKFQIDPDEERKRHEEALKKVDPRTAEILQKHLRYPSSLPDATIKTEVEEKELEQPPQRKGPGAFIENSIPESNR